ncbi:hypothetical protein V5799_003044 [Amblyomma americanum]|uniref:Uncharacterized protein n=1 Tax=Amblyomma americanum TaxID=6943 RepID=A0AAQ4DA28_AMBAM
MTRAPHCRNERRRKAPTFGPDRDVYSGGTSCGDLTLQELRRRPDRAMAEERPVETSQGVSTPVPGPRAFAFNAVAAFGAMVVIVVLLSVYERQLPLRIRSASFCCPDVLDNIFSAANSNVDPCRNIFGHTCYALVTTRGDHPPPANLNTHPVDGFPKTDAGRAIAAYYRACVLSLDNYASVGRASAAVIGSVVNPPRSAPISSHGLLALIIDLSLKYGLPSVIEFSVDVTSNFEPYLKILPSPLVSPTESLAYSLLPKLKNDALETVYEDLQFHVDRDKVDAMLGDLPTLNVQPTQNYALDSIGELVPDVSPAEWKDLLGRYNVSDRHTIFSIQWQTLTNLFHTYFSPERREIAVITVLVAASVKLASVVLINADSRDAEIQTCRNRSQELMPLWILDQIRGVPTQPQDTAIKRAYDIVAATVLRIARSGMETSDLQDLEELFNEMRLLLPSEVVPAGLAIPMMTSVYAHAELVTRAYILQAQRHQALSSTISGTSLEDFLKNHVTIVGTVVTIPTSVYSLIPLSEDSEAMLLMSTVGVYIADSLWQFVFAKNWSASTNAALKAYRGCLLKNSRSIIEWPSRFLWLSVHTSVEASMDAEWDSVVNTGAAWNATRGQLFYMVFIRYLMCPAPHSMYPTFSQDVNSFMSGFRDFYRTFRCNVTASKITGAICSLRLLPSRGDSS